MEKGVEEKKCDVSSLGDNELREAHNDKRSPVTSFNTLEMDVRSSTHEVFISQANICTKTCNVN